MSCITGCTHSTTTDDVLSAAKYALTAADGALESVPIPGLAVTTKIVLAIIERVEFLLLTPSLPLPQETRSTRQGLEDLAKEIGRLVQVLTDGTDGVQARLGEYKGEEKEKLVNSLKNSSEVSQQTQSFIDDLNKIKSHADELYNGPFFLRCFHSSRDAETLKDLRQEVQRAIEYFKLRCLATITNTINDVLKVLEALNEKVEVIQENVAEVAQNIQTERDDGILEKLPHANAHYRAPEVAAKSNFVAGTREGLFEQLDAWVDEPTGKPICVLTGGAGTGKSTIAVEFAHRLHERSNSPLGASFFFVRGVEDLISTRLFFPTLAYQLAYSQDTLYPLIVDAARKHLKMGAHQQMKYEAENLIHVPLCDANPEHPPIFLVVDAVDECTENAATDVPEMLRLLIACVKEVGFPLRLFLTSRPADHVEYALSSGAKDDLHTISLHDLPADSVRRDISVFIKHQMKQIPNAESVLNDDVIERIAQRADGLFIYAQTAMNFLAESPDFIDERIQTLLSEKEREVALGPLYDLYLTVLESAFAKTELDHPTFRQNIQAVLGCIALLRDAISPLALESLTGISVRDSSIILHRLRSVLLFDRRKPDEPFRTLHATFPQLLLDRKRCTNKLFFVDAKRESARLSDGCFRVLLALERNPLELPPSTATSEVPDLEERVEERIASHVQYACAHWAAHVAQSPDNQEELFAHVQGFANKSLLVWIETLAWMGRLDLVDGMLKTTINWWKVPGKVPRLLEQARQWLLEHRAEVEEHPDIVYSSGISQDGSHAPATKMPTTIKKLSIADT